MSRNIPDRWTDYTPIGKNIEGTRFIAFKVPLEEDISKTVKRNHQLDPRILLKKIPNLGIIIDLTNTNRYYNPSHFVKRGVIYKKLRIPGHVVPEKCLSNEFNRIVKEFIQKNNDNGESIDSNKLIGVHCTHGVNRTGYFICKYMISQMNMEPSNAVDRFANARGHEIERQNYITDLCKRTKNETKKNNSNYSNNYSDFGSHRRRNERRYREDSNTYSDYHHERGRRDWSYRRIYSATDEHRPRSSRGHLRFD